MKKNIKKITTYFIIISLLLIGIIYAILQANLQINGIAKIKSNTWDIHFDNIQVNENSVSIGTGDSPATIDPENNCKVDFSVTLSLPGDFYEFTVDAVNAGTIDAMIGTLTKTIKVNNTVVSEVPNYLNYSVTYSDGLEIIENHKLSAGKTEIYLVRLEYRTDIEELPEATTIETSLEPQYIQADSGAIQPPHPINLYNVFQTEALSGSGLVHEYTGSHNDSFTQEGTEKIYHWYAETDDNAETIKDKWNVTFGDFCWQMWRTTDTGGIKLIYNGVASYEYEYQVPLNQDDYTIVTNSGFIWNSETNTWDITITEGQEKEISFTVPDGKPYYAILTGTSEAQTGGYYFFYKDGQSLTYGNIYNKTETNFSYEFGRLTSSNIIKMQYSTSSSVDSPITFQLKMIKKENVIGIECNNSGVDQQIGTSKYNTNSNSLAYTGYMIPNSNKIRTFSAGYGTLFGSGVSYDGNTYTLTNTSSTMDDNHHYGCATSGNTTCQTVRYYYFYYNYYGNTYRDNYYIELNGERNIEELLSDMLNSDNVNQNNSKIKTTIDTWYQNNMTEYTSKLEDTIFCNDRSISNYSESGWNPNGGSKNEYLKFKSFTVKDDLSCENLTDQFSMSNTKAQLPYPVGLMTLSEANLLNNNVLRNTGKDYWVASPDVFKQTPNSYNAYVGFINSSGKTSSIGPYVENGVRPAISLKPGTIAVSGDGSKNNPYVVEEEK